jgi:LysM repeat protein
VPSGGSRQALHIVEKGETGYAIAKANGLTWQQLREANNLPEDAKLQPGQRLMIPSRNVDAVYKPAPKAVKTTTPAHSTHTKAAPEPPQDQAVYIPPDERNEPAKPSASVPAAAQPVKTDKPVENKTDENPFLPRPAEAAKPAPPNAIKNENVNPDDYVAVFSGYNDSGKKKITYRGIGMFMQVENPGNQFLALYNYADMGSILKVTNLMSKEIVYVKVIGKVPATDTQKEVILKVSSEAAAKLKVSEDRFLVEVAGYNND